MIENGMILMIKYYPLKREEELVCISIIRYVFPKIHTLILIYLPLIWKHSGSQKPNKTILIGNLYRPPQGNAKNCIDMIEHTLSNVDLQKVEIILMGDLNLDLLDKNNKFAKELVNTLKQMGLRQLIKEPTRYSNSKDSCLDLVFTNSNIIARSGVGNINISDHQMVFATRKKVKFFKKKCDFIGRSYRNYNVVNYSAVNVRLHPYVTEEILTCYYLCINRPTMSICLKRK